MSSDLVDEPRIDDPAARELPAMRAAWPAWTLAAVALLTFFLQVAHGTADDPDGLRGLALSADSLQQGQWWTLATHAVVQRGFFGHIGALTVFVAAGLLTLAAQDKDWMGGWRALAVFAVASAGAALVHFLSGRPEELTGMWQGVAGLAAFYLVSGRWPQLRPEAQREDPRKPDQWRPTKELIANWTLLWVYGGNGLRDTPLFGEGADAIYLGGAVFLGGVVLAVLVGRWGSSLAVKLLHGAMLCVYMVAVAVFVVGVLADAPLAFWVAPLGGAMTGLGLGLVERSLSATTPRDT